MRRSAFALGGIVVLILFSQFTVQRSLQAGRFDTRYLNIAARERLFTQQIGSAASALEHTIDLTARQNLLDAIDASEANCRNLRDGNVAQGIPPQPDSGISSLLDVALADQAVVRESARRLLATLDQRDSHPRIVHERADAVRAAEASLLVTMERVVDAFERLSAAHAVAVVYTEQFLSAVSVLVLMLMGVVIFAPTARTIGQQLKRQGELLEEVSRRERLARELAADAARTAEQRKAAEERFRVLFEQSSDAHLLLDGTNILDCNPATLAMLNCVDQSKVLGQHPAIFSPEFQPDGTRSINKAVEIDRRVRAEGQHRFEWTHRKLTGEVFPVEVALTLVKLGGKEMQLVVWHDLTERKRAEETLRASERRFAAFMDNSPAAAVIKDDEGRVVYVNRTLVEQFNVSAKDWVGKTDAEIWPANVAQKIAENDLAVLKGGQAMQFYETLAGPDGTPREFLSFKFPISDEKGRCFMAAMSIDVTDQRMAEEHLVRANEAAEAARKAAQAATRAKSEFLANMSHEIRTPMNAIIGFADLLLEPIQTPGEREQYIRTIQRNGRHLLDLINDILDLSKIEAEKMTIESLSCEVPQLAAEVASMMRPRALEKGLNFEIRFDGPVPRTVMTDPLRVRQVLVNLVGNAVKFTQAGRVTLSIKYLPSKGGRNLIRFDVIDTGIGMSEKEMNRLFKPFTQADESTTRRFGGTGLGLAISKRLAAALGGDLLACSQPGTGSTFSFTVETGQAASVEFVDGLSEAVDVPAPAGEPGGAGRLRLAGRRILLVEDGADNRKLLCLRLRAAGAHVDTAENGQLALGSVDRLPVELILMDMQMPELDGYGAATELRKRGFTKPIIALTAHAMSGDREKCIAAGCTDYLTKPIDPALLVQTILQNLAAYPPTGAAAVRIEKSLRSLYEKDDQIADLLAEFVAGLPAQVRELTELVASKKWKELRQVSHGLKGVGGGYGFPQITEAAGKLEALLKTDATGDAVIPALDELLTVVRSVEGYQPTAETTAVSG